MRVASDTFSNNLMFQLNVLQDRQNRLQTQAATGQKITLPEDDPAAMREVLDLQTQSHAVTQYQTNITSLQQVATASYNIIDGLKTISDRAGEIATQADGLASPQQLSAYATEVDNLIKQTVQLANTKNNGNYLLGGTRTDAPPFAVTTDSNGNITAVSYQGNTDVASNEIAPNTIVSAQTLGANSTGAGPRGLITDSRSGADFINHLIALRNDLTSGNTAAITATDQMNLAKDEDNILYHVSANGALQSRLETTSSLASQQNLSLNSQISQETGADLAQTLTQLSQAQTAYQAALQSGAKIMGMSLLNFIQ